MGTPNIRGPVKAEIEVATNASKRTKEERLIVLCNSVVDMEKIDSKNVYATTTTVTRQPASQAEGVSINRHRAGGEIFNNTRQICWK